MKRRASMVAAWLALGCARNGESVDSLRDTTEGLLRHGGVATRSSPDDSAEKLLTEPLGVETATRVALLNNARVRAAYEELGIAHADIVEALRLPNPELQGAIRFSKEKPELEVAAMLGLGQLVLLPLRGNAADIAYEAAQREVVGMILALAFDVRSAFIDYQAALQTVELSRTVLAATDASAEAATRLHEAGNLPDLDVATERAFAEEARVAARRAETSAAEARARLAALMGVGQEQPAWSIHGRLADPPATELPLDGLETRAVRNSLSFGASVRRAEAASARATAESTERWLPGLKAGVSARRETHWAVGPAVALEVPLFYQGQGRVDAARGEERRQKALGQASAVEVRNDARATATRLGAARDNALLYRDVLLPLRKRVLDETELHYNAMTVGVFQLLAAKRDQIETARTYVELLRDYWHARNDVARLLAGAALTH